MRPRQFKVTNLVMRKAHPFQLEHKLSPKWTGPFRIVEVLGSGAYRLENPRGGSHSSKVEHVKPQVLFQLRRFVLMLFLYEQCDD